METVVIAAGAPVTKCWQPWPPPDPRTSSATSVIGRLARTALAGDFDWRPVRVSTNSEPLLMEDRQAIVEAWDVPVHNLWGSTEIGVQAGCSVGEGLRLRGRGGARTRRRQRCPGGPDKPAARTLATGLANRTFPFIRYDLGDDVTLLPRPCECGSAFVRVADIGGRRDDDFRYGSIAVPAITFRHVLGTDPRITEYQVTQTAAGADIVTVGHPDIDAAAVLAALRRCGLPEPRSRSGSSTVSRAMRRAAS